MITLALLIVPTIAAILTFLSGNRWSKKVAFLTSIPALIISLQAYFELNAATSSAEMLSFSTLWIENPLVFFDMRIDGLSFLMIALTNFLVPIIILSGFGVLKQNERAFYALILLMQAALNGVFMAADGFVYYVFWELALLPIYFIALIWGAEGSRNITFKFFVYTLGGSLFMLLAFIFLYLKGGYTPSFQIDNLYLLSLSQSEQFYVFLAFFLAFAIKIPIIPFHTWQADTYTAAPSQGTMLLSGIMLKMGIYSLIRWLLPITSSILDIVVPVVMVLCVIGIIYASIIAIQQDNIKRLLAYSSLAHVGLISAGVFTSSKLGIEGAVVQMISHGINVVGLFFAAEIIQRRTSTLDIGALGGIRSQAPWFSTYFLIIVLGSIALPLTNGFIGEFLLLFSVWQYSTWIGVLAATTIILGAVYMLRMYQRAMLGTENVTTQNFKDLSFSEHLTFLPLVIMVFVLGVFPQPIINIVKPVITSIIEIASN